MTYYIIDQITDEVLSHHETAEGCAKWFDHLRECGNFVRIEKGGKRIPYYTIK